MSRGHAHYADCKWVYLLAAAAFVRGETDVQGCNVVLTSDHRNGVWLSNVAGDASSIKEMGFSSLCRGGMSISQHRATSPTPSNTIRRRNNIFLNDFSPILFLSNSPEKAPGPIKADISSFFFFFMKQATLVFKHNRLSSFKY